MGFIFLSLQSFHIIPQDTIRHNIPKINKKEFDTTFKYDYTSIARSYLFELSDDEIFASFKDNNFTNNTVYKTFKDLYQIKNIRLVIYQPVINNTNECEITLEELLNFKKFLEGRWQTLEDVSYTRGGWCKVGSCVWADIRESVENELPVMFKKQIVGHTQMESKPYITSRIACLDVRKCFILNTETDEINEIS